MRLNASATARTPGEAAPAATAAATIKEQEDSKVVKQRKRSAREARCTGGSMMGRRAGEGVGKSGVEVSLGVWGWGMKDESV